MRHLEPAVEAAKCSSTSRVVHALRAAFDDNHTVQASRKLLTVTNPYHPSTSNNARLTQFRACSTHHSNMYSPACSVCYSMAHRLHICVVLQLPHAFCSPQMLLSRFRNAVQHAVPPCAGRMQAHDRCCYHDEWLHTNTTLLAPTAYAPA